ncbi:MAG: hypothetical protein HY673_16910 [Chloroflexi bacterium]|nr:hypothetical protein [Chloroflexota bacterium]
MGHYNSFLVKVWSENGRDLVRGHIQHAGAEEQAYFLNWEKMLQFMARHLGEQPDRQLAEEKDSRLSQSSPDEEK